MRIIILIFWPTRIALGIIYKSFKMACYSVSEVFQKETAFPFWRAMRCFLSVFCKHGDAPAFPYVIIQSTD